MPPSTCPDVLILFNNIVLAGVLNANVKKTKKQLLIKYFYLLLFFLSYQFFFLHCRTHLKLYHKKQGRPDEEDDKDSWQKFYELMNQGRSSADTGSMNDMSKSKNEKSSSSGCIVG